MEITNTYKTLDGNGNKVGSVVEYSGKVDGVTCFHYIAYNLSDAEVYSGQDFLDACAALRGERLRSDMK